MYGSIREWASCVLIGYPSGQDGPIKFSRVGPARERIDNILFSRTIDPLLTMFLRLDIGLVLFWVFIDLEICIGSSTTHICHL